MIWQKKLAASDVERSQIGNATGRLKLVKAGFKVNGKLIDQTKYFREDIFGDLDWVEKEHTEKEITETIFVINILGESYGIHKFTRFWYKQYVNKKRWSVIFRHIFVGVHFIPLILQALTIINPGLDNIILGVIGLFLYKVSS